MKVDQIFRNNNGKTVIWQFPNVLLWAWIVCTIFTRLFVHGRPHTGFAHLGTATLFAWAYLEIRSGESLFRRILGGVVMLWIIYGFFR